MLRARRRSTEPEMTLCLLQEIAGEMRDKAEKQVADTLKDLHDSITKQAAKLHRISVGTNRGELTESRIAFHNATLTVDKVISRVNRELFAALSRNTVLHKSHDELAT